MEFFLRAKAVRLKSQHNKYLLAEEDEYAVKQSRSGASKNARWAVELTESGRRIRLKSCLTWKYLAASDEPFLLGMTGKKVVQESPRMRAHASVEWEPIRDGSHLKLRAHKGTYLRANGRIPPWTNSVTHDVPARTATLDWVLWTVDVLEVDYEKSTEDDGDRTVENKGMMMDEDDDDGSSAKSVRSVHSSMEMAEPTPRQSPAASFKSDGVSPFVQRVVNESKHDRHSNSFNSLRSMLDGLKDVLDEEESHAHDVSEPHDVKVDTNPHPLEMTMAKQTLKELKDLDFNSVISSSTRTKKLQKSISVLSSDPNFAYVASQITALKTDHDTASKDLVEYSSLCAQKLATKKELRRDAAKANELETLEVAYTNKLEVAKAKKEELLKQLEEIENTIMVAERVLTENTVEVEELISQIGEKSESLREMEQKEKAFQSRKYEAERTLERVEDDWERIKGLFSDF